MSTGRTLPIQHWTYTAYIFFLPWTSTALVNVPQLGFGLQISHFLLVLLAVMVMGQLITGGGPWGWRTPATRWLLVFLAVAGASIFLSARIPFRATYYGETPWIRSIKQFGYLALACTAYLVPLALVWTERTILLALRAFIYSAVASAAFGAYQFLSFTFHLPYPAFIHNNISTPQGYGQFYEGLKRVSGLTGEPAMFGFYLLGALAILLAFQLNGASLTRRPRLERGAVVFLLVMLVLSTSFSAFGGAVLMAGTFLILTGGGLKRTVRLGILGVSFLTVALIVSRFANIPGLFVINRLMNSISGESYSTFVRAQMGLAALRIFAAHPLLGVGIGNFGFYAGQYVKLAAGHFWEPMSLFPRLLAEFGIVGTLPFLLFVTRVVQDGRALSAMFKEHGDVYRFSLALGLTVAFVTLVGTMFVAIPALIWLNLWFTASTLQAMRNVYVGSARGEVEIGSTELGYVRPSMEGGS